MSTVKQNLSKNKNLSQEHVQKGIEIFREYFSEDTELANVSDQELLEKTCQFIQSEDLFNVDFGELEKNEGFAGDGPTCAVAIAVVVIDCVFLGLAFCGLHAANERKIAKASAETVAEVIEANMPVWKRMIKDLVDASSVTDKAKAIFAILKEAFKQGIVKSVIKQIKHNMHWWNWVITGVAVIAQIVGLLASDGAAFIAELALNGVAVANIALDGAAAIKTCGG